MLRHQRSEHPALLKHAVWVALKRVSVERGLRIGFMVNQAVREYLARYHGIKLPDHEDRDKEEAQA